MYDFSSAIAVTSVTRHPKMEVWPCRYRNHLIAPIIPQDTDVTLLEHGGGISSSPMIINKSDPNMWEVVHSLINGMSTSIALQKFHSSHIFTL